MGFAIKYPLLCYCTLCIYPRWVVPCTHGALWSHVKPPFSTVNTRIQRRVFRTWQVRHGASDGSERRSLASPAVARDLQARRSVRGASERGAGRPTVTEVWGARRTRSFKELRSKPLPTRSVAGGHVNSSTVVPHGHRLPSSTQSRCAVKELQVRLSVGHLPLIHTPLALLSIHHIPHHFPAYLNPHSYLTVADRLHTAADCRGRALVHLFRRV